MGYRLWNGAATVLVGGLQAAKTHLSRLVDEAVAGKEIVLLKAGKPLVRLTSVQPDVSPRTSDAWRRQVPMAPNFNAEYPEIIALFEGSGRR
jgi:prevent-host-death family protein